MLKKTTNQIIAAGRSAMVKYDLACESIAPGQEGVVRRNAFEGLLAELTDCQPEQAFIKLYDFCVKDNAFASRLICNIHNELKQIIDLPKPYLMSGRGSAEMALHAERSYHAKVNALRAIAQQQGLLETPPSVVRCSI
jgi:hypothetical protein